MQKILVTGANGFVDSRMESDFVVILELSK